MRTRSKEEPRWRRAFACRSLGQTKARHRFSRWHASHLSLFTVLILSACGGATGPPQIVQPPVTGLVATLEDEVRDLPNARIAWSTYWQLCWPAYPGATAYELQPLTGEGAPKTLRRQRDTCMRVQAAAGENDKAQGLINRDIQLSLERGQLAYQVRAVLDGNRASAWSRAVAVGEAMG